MWFEASASDRLVPSVDSIAIGAVYYSGWFGDGGVYCNTSVVFTAI